MIKYHNIKSNQNSAKFDSYFPIAQLKIDQFGNFWHKFDILDQGTTFLFYEIFEFITTKNAFLKITQKGLDQKF